ncbi:MAG: succinate dehydrogenase [Sulfuricurvum sp. PC08-66]|nr:MAG: succinate dehydrogenase [Sulfuricurvum sp. PC08-66]
MLDILIVGAGGAGLTAALEAHRAGAKVAILSKSYPTRSQTAMAQGGINAVLTPSDSIEHHIADTLQSAHDLASIEAITQLCQGAPKAINWLGSLGMPFSRDTQEGVAQRRLGGASAPRACYAQDYTGLKLIHTLYDQVIEAGIPLYHEHFLLNCIVEENHILGITALDIRTSTVKAIAAKSVILATGGYSKLYGDFSTNAQGATGDGIAAALRAGARISDIEFVQFHPTALASSSILISESARGAGGLLIDGEGKRFVDELAPRDVVARAIYEAIERTGRAYLDIRHLGEAYIEEHLPQERKLAQLYEGVDCVHALIPIKPAAHYTMGGIEVDAQGMSAVRGLFAVGECANAHIHGANRLGGNSLLELVVFGRDTARHALTFAQKSTPPNANDTQFQKDSAFIHACFHRFTNQIDFYEKQTFLSKIAYRNAGLFRNEMHLKGVLGVVRQIQKELPFMGVKDKLSTYNTNLVEFLEFGNIIELAEVLLVGAINRIESRGAHYRSDYPQSHPHFAHPTISWKEQGVLCNAFE